MVLHALGVIMEENLKITHLKPFAIILALCINSLYQELQNKMEFLREKNRSIQEIIRIMLNEIALPKYFQVKAINTACYVLNCVLIRLYLNKILYELWKDKKPNIGYFKVFGCKYFIINTNDNFGKFDLKSDVGIFLGYSNTSKAYRVYNNRNMVVQVSMHVKFDESNPSSAAKVVINDDAYEELQEESLKDK